MTRTSFLRSGVVALVLGATAVPCSVAAQQPPTAATPEARFHDAQAAHDAGRFEEALAGFQALAEETKSPNAMLYVARSLRSLGRLPEAHDAMRATAKEATTRAEAEAKYASTRDAAVSELAVLALQVGFVVVAIADAPADAQVTVDGAPLPNERLGSPITVEPGAHAVELQVPGAQVVQRSVQVKAGETKTIALAVGRDDPAPAPTPPPPTASPSRGGGLRTAGFVVGGVGLASLGAGIVTGLMANAHFSELEDTCGTARCTDPGAADTIDGGKTLETVANVTLIGGAILVAAAVPMIVFGGPNEDLGETAFAPTPGGGTVRWSTAF